MKKFKKFEVKKNKINGGDSGMGMEYAQMTYLASGGLDIYDWGTGIMYNQIGGIME